MPIPTRALRVAGPGLVVAIYLAVAWRFAFSVDAAWVDARFARNLAAGLGPVFNPGDPPIEAWSSLLAVLVGAVAESAGASGLVAAQVVGVLAGALLLVVLHGALVARLGVREVVALPTLLGLAAAPMVGAWATGSPGDLPGILALAWCFDRVVLARSHRLAAVSVLLLVVARYDGPAWAALFLAMAGWWRATELGRRDAPLPRVARRAAAIELRPLGDAVVAWVVSVGALTAARLAVFGSAVPWALARHAPDPAGGLAYLIAGGVGSGLPLTWLAVAHPASRAGIGRLAAVALGVAVAGAAIWGGEGEPFARLLLPAVPFGALIFARVVDHEADLGRWGTAASLVVVAAVVGHLPAWDVPLAPKRIRDAAELRPDTARVRTELDQWRFTRNQVTEARALALAVVDAVGPDASWTVGSPGVRGYVSDLTILDVSGATDPVAGSTPRARLRPTVLRARFARDRQEADALAATWAGSDAGYEAQVVVSQDHGWLVLQRKRPTW